MAKWQEGSGFQITKFCQSQRPNIPLLRQTLMVSELLFSSRPLLCQQCVCRVPSWIPQPALPSSPAAQGGSLTEFSLRVRYCVRRSGEHRYSQFRVRETMLVLQKMKCGAPNCPAGGAESILNSDLSSSKFHTFYTPPSSILSRSFMVFL